MKRSQAAMEFLMTYGWFMLAALTMISLLFYSGTFNLSRFLPDKCVISPDITCRDFSIAPGGISLSLFNGAGDAINVTRITYGGWYVRGQCVNSTETRIENGNFTSFTSLCEISAPKGEKATLAINLTYYRTSHGPPFSHNVAGELVAKVGP